MTDSPPLFIVPLEAVAKARSTFAELAFEKGSIQALAAGCELLGAELVLVSAYTGEVEARIGTWLQQLMGRRAHLVNSLEAAALLPAPERWVLVEGNLSPLDGARNLELEPSRRWETLPNRIRAARRRAVVHRKTLETDIQITLALEGTGKAEINTGLGFFDHMLEQIARHGSMDLFLTTAGDLHVDEHHTVEDTALALGQAFSDALGDKRGLQRYGFLLPMDDALAQVAVDFGGRPWLVWEVQFRRERIGDMPTELFFHFFKSFCDTARCNLAVQARGDNEHHLIESIFKSFARALRMAVRIEGQELPSTKGIL